MKGELLQQLTQTAERYSMPFDDAQVVVAVSGGADSLALLHAVWTLQSSLKVKTLEALHIHHGIRQEEALRDETAVRQFCDAHNIPLSVYHIDVPTEAAQHHESEEEAGRRLRYAIYAEWIQKGWLVLTGHTRSDTAETVLLHLTRGCGVAGLTGIPPVRDGVCRPLIECSRADTEAYCAANAIEYVTDSTNADVRYARNRVRHEVLPTLCKINPQAEESIARLAKLAAEETAFVREQAAALLKQAQDKNGLRKAVLREVSPFLAKATLRLAFPLYDVEQKHWDALYGLVDDVGAVTLPSGKIVRADATHILFPSDAPPTPPFCMPLLLDTPMTLGHTTYCASVYPYEKFCSLQKIHKKLFSFAASYDIINGGLYVRQRQDGDRYHPCNRGGKTLKQLQNEAKMSPYERAFLPIICDDDGILLVPGFGCDERARITETTKQVLCFLPT